MGVMSMALGTINDPTIDINKILRMAIVHDLAESLVGDITPHDDVSKEDKNRLEEAAMRKITTPLLECGQQIYDLWAEFSLRARYSAYPSTKRSNAGMKTV